MNLLVTTGIVFPTKQHLASADSPNFTQSREVEKRCMGNKMRSSTATAVSSMIFALMCVISHGKNLIELCRVLFLWGVRVFLGSDVRVAMLQCFESNRLVSCKFSMRRYTF